jgi:D-alanyl-D-alanine carboxypeptidase/D-alanyl-D-alanine-endopeptidase (penicillin-binding protein 4)
VRVSVLDAASGDLLAARQAQAGATPASTAKLLTAAAALVALEPDTRLRTGVAPGAAAGEYVLVGGGDATLTTAPAPSGSYPATASLADLAARTAAALAPEGRTAITLRYDARLFAAPAAAPSWPPGYLASGVVGPVTALSADQGRVAPDGDARVADPALEAARRFAQALGAAGVAVTGEPTPVGAADPVAQPDAFVASVESAPVAALVERMLADSDNDLAEALAHLAAAAAGDTADFAGGARATTAALAGLGLDVTGLSLLDGSGLATGSRAAPALVTALLAHAYGPDGAPLRTLLAGLAVGGFNGTLADRFDSGAAAAAAGLVRGKTGTLTGTTALAGSVVTAEGRTLLFTFFAEGVPAGGTEAARAALDQAAAALAGCGCR